MFKTIKSQIPNTITCLGMVAGLLAIIFSFRAFNQIGGLKGYQWVWIFIGISAVTDFCDGLSARLLHAYSDLGKNLDSLSDLICFGIAPGMLIFNILNEVDCEWSFVIWMPLMIPVLGAVRLARFNIDPEQKETFKGLPIPANAIFWIGFSTLLLTPGYIPAWVVCFVILCVSLLMVASVRMFSLKLKNFNFSAVNIKRLIIIISAIVLVIFLKVQGLMWVVAEYIFLSVFYPSTSNN